MEGEVRNAKRCAYLMEPNLNAMNQDLKARSEKFALDIISLVKDLPNNKVADVLGKQLLRSGTSVAANYRAACRARSLAEFISKIGIVEEESDESVLWLELIKESDTHHSVLLEQLLKESTELTAIFTKSGKTAKENKLAKSKAVS